MQAMTINEFMNPVEAPRKRSKLSKATSVTLPITTAGGTKAAFAEEAVGAGVKEKILHSFDPLMDLITALSYPIAGVMLGWGALLMMVGQRDKGFAVIQSASLGYILVQLAPLFLELLVGIGSAI